MDGFRGICRRCWRAFSSAPERITEPPPYVDAVHVGGTFGGPFRRLIHAFKYHRRFDLAEVMVSLWWRRHGRRIVPPDAVIPVPMSLWKRCRRGYNSAEVLGRALSVRCGKARFVQPLSRRWWSPSQTRLDREARWANSRRNHGLKRKLEPDIRTVWLVDDVLTTGATLSACARLLREAGVTRIVGCVIAQEPLRRGNLAGRHRLSSQS